MKYLLKFFCFLGFHHPKFPYQHLGYGRFLSNSNWNDAPDEYKFVEKLKLSCQYCRKEKDWYVYEYY